MGQSKRNLPSILFLLTELVISSVLSNQCGLPPSPRAVYSKTKLPEAEYGMSVIYDGEDSILIFNGRPDNREIYRFNVVTERLSTLGTLPVKGTYAPLVRIQDGSYLYFGNDIPQRVFRFDPITNSGSIVAELPSNLQNMRSFFTTRDPHKVYLTSASYNPGSTGSAKSLSMHEFNTATFCIGGFRNITGGEAYVPAATFGKFAYIFSTGSQSQSTPSGSAQIILESKSVQFLGRTNVMFPSESNGATTVTTGNYAYMMGGRMRSVPSRDGILQYHPNNNEFKFIRIDEMPLKWEERFQNPPAMAFVEKLNRIYFFGGRTSGESGESLDLIWFIDVGLME